MEVKVMYTPIAPPPLPPTVDIIGMTYEDAKVLRAILGVVSGSSDGPRGAAKRLFKALDDAGVPWDFKNLAPDNRYDNREYTITGWLHIEKR